MRMRTVFLLVALCALPVQGQPTFEKLYDTGTSFIFNLTELPGQNVLIGLGWSTGISRLDPFGNVLHYQSNWSDTLLSFGCIRNYTASEWVFASGYRKDACMGGLERYPVIGKLDSSGNILAAAHYRLNQGCSNIAADVLATNDGGVVAWGYRKDFFALKVDQDLNPLWAKTFGNNGGFQFIKELPGGDLLAGISMDTAGAVVARMDANGQFIWCKSYMRPSGMVNDAVIESDDSFIITGFTDTLGQLGAPWPPAFHSKLFMMKLNGMGEVQWCKGYESVLKPWYADQRSHIEPTLDAKYVFLANLGYEQGNWHNRPFLMKTDLNGDTLWTRSIGGSLGDRYYARDLLAYSDGGFMISAEIQGDLPDGQSSMSYVFKTDSEGHMPCYEKSHPVEITDLFPIDSSFTLHSIDGAVAGPVFANDTLLDPFAVYNACDFLTSEPSPYRVSRHMRVRPNPNTGRFTVEFQDPLVRDSYYGVYDSMGKLLFQRAAAHGQKTEEVDLTGYAKGSYVIRFTDPGGTCYERVVLE